jgi:hypothetical protein
MPAQSAMNGQSLPQSGSVGLPGQHGMSAGIPVASISAIPAITPAEAGIAAAAAIAGRIIGLSTSPTIASSAKQRAMADRSVTTLLYHNTRRLARAQIWFDDLGSG